MVPRRLYQWIYSVSDEDMKLDEEEEVMDIPPTNQDENAPLSSFVPGEVKLYKGIFRRIWDRTNEMKDRLDLQQHRLHKKNTMIQLSVVYLSGLSAFIQALTSSKYEFMFPESLDNETNTDLDIVDQNNFSSVVPVITLCISTYSSLIIATARHLKIEERVGKVCNIKDRFAEMLSRSKYYLVSLRPWEDPSYYAYDPKQERRLEWLSLVKKLDKEYHHLVDIRKELYSNYYKVIHVSSYNKYTMLANKLKYNKGKAKEKIKEKVEEKVEEELRFGLEQIQTQRLPRSKTPPRKP